MPQDLRTGSLGSVENALEVLLLLREHASVRPSQISAHLGVSRSTTHRLLRTLSFYGMIEQNEQSSGYHAGPVLAELGLSAAHQTNLARTLHPFLQELSHEVGETTHAIVLEGASCTFVDSVESTHALRTTSRVGTRYPAYVVSGGKLLLAQLDRAALLELFPRPQLPALNQRSLTSREDLFKQLDEIKNLGYATNFGESELGIAAVAVAQQTISG
ncbi:MAG: IclR family transcriptional regulator, partial [Solirubrobacteraceae bacterium]